MSGDRSTQARDDGRRGSGAGATAGTGKAGKVDKTPRDRRSDSTPLAGGTSSSAGPSSEAVDASTRAVSAEQGSLPGWMAPGLLGLLALAGLAVVLLRRRAAVRP